VVLKKKQTVLKQNEELLNYVIRSGEQRYSYAKEQLNNIYKAKVALAMLRNTQLMLENEIRKNNILLNTLMNQDKNIVFDIDTNIIGHNYESAPVDTSALHNQRSDLKAIDKSIALQKLNREFQQTRNKPDFGISYAHMFSYGGTPDLYSLMGTVTIPIASWSSKEYKANIQGIHFEILGLEQQKRAIVNNTAGQLSTLAFSMANIKEQLKNYKENILPAYQNSYKTSLIAYEQNTGELFIVLDALQALQTARLDYLSLSQDLLQLEANYEKEIEK
jgi:cobalt-zinc-cadmium efflux system outer membrane protein